MSKRLLVRVGPGLALLLLLLAGCQGARPRQDEPVPPFVFRSLDLKQQDAKGQPAWELTSPEARYDLRRRTARAESPKGLIYRDGQPLYRLRADSGIVINDGQAILLEGHLRLERLGEQPVLIQANRARWLPRQNLMLVDRVPVAYDRQGRLRAQRAQFRFDQDSLELSGAPRLERWAQRFNPFAALPQQPPATTLQVASLRWQPGTGELVAAGPVIGQHNSAAGSGGSRSQRLRAEALDGNTRSQIFNLKGVVQIEDAGEKQHFKGRDLRLDLHANSASSALPFTASRGPLKVRGVGLRLEADARQVVIEAGCHLEQPGERLDAQRCRWNWQTGSVEADGAVELQRSAHQQLSRASHLQGKLGTDGEITISTPGGRVVSHFQVQPVQVQPIQVQPVQVRPSSR